MREEQEGSWGAGVCVASSPGRFFTNITAQRAKNTGWYGLYMGVSGAIVNSTVKLAVKQLYISMKIRINDTESNIRVLSDTRGK